MTAAMEPLFGAEEAAGDVLWFVPVDRYGRALPDIAVLPGDPKGWNAGAIWAYLATRAAEELGPDASRADLYERSTAARFVYYSLMGADGRRRLELEITRHGVRL
jgi:hypothetical protein